MKREHRFWDRFAKRYARQPIADPESYELKLGITREYLEPEMRVLEFGCGTGGTAIAHAPYVAEIDCIDAAPNMIALAQEKAVDQGAQNITFDTSDFDDFRCNPKSYDAVLGLSILHLVDDRDAAISKVHDLLRPGGVFISSTPCLGDKLAFFKFLSPLGAFGILPKLRVFTATELEASLTSAGFKTVHHWQPGADKAVFIVAQKKSQRIAQRANGETIFSSK